MYRQARDNTPPLVIPGKGVGLAVVGRSLPEEILEAFGSDCQVSRYDSGEVFDIDYDYVSEGNYAADRPAQGRRPAGFKFQFSLLSSIEVGVYQSALRTPEGVTIGSTKREVLRTYGTPTLELPGESFATLRYVDLGIQLAIDNDDVTVTTITVFRARG